jgi:hypothetical protein
MARPTPIEEPTMIAPLLSEQMARERSRSALATARAGRARRAVRSLRFPARPAAPDARR